MPYLDIHRHEKTKKTTNAVSKKPVSCNNYWVESPGISVGWSSPSLEEKEMLVDLYARMVNLWSNLLNFSFDFANLI